MSWTIASLLIWTVALRRAWRKSWVVSGSWLLWLAWIALSLAASSQPLKGLEPLSRWATFVAFFSLAAAWGERERRIWFWGLSLSGAVLALAALWTGRINGIFSETMVGLLPPYYNYTVFAEAAAFAAVFAALIHRERPGKYLRWLMLGLLALLLSCLILARARGGILVVCASSLLVALRHPRAEGRAWLLGSLALGAGILAAGILLLRGASPAYFLKLDKAFRRPHIWRAALQITQDHPIFGEGPGNFEAGFLRHNFPSNYGQANYQFTSAYAHGEWLQAAAETGWVGLALLLLALAGTLRRLPAPGKTSLPQETAMAALAAMGLHLMIDNMLHVPTLGLLFFSALACATGPEAKSALPVWPRASWMIFSCAGLALSALAWIPSSLGRRYAQGLERETDAAKRLELAQKSVHLFPADSYLRETMAREWMSLNPPRPDEALKELETASQLNPTNALCLGMRAEILRGYRRWAEVLALAEEALRLEPNYLRARFMRAEALARLGRNSLAQAELAELDRRRRLLEAGGFYRSTSNHYELMIGAR